MYSRTVNLFVRRNVILCNRNSVVWLKHDDCNRSIYSFTFLNPGKLFALCCAGRGLDTFNEFDDFWRVRIERLSMVLYDEDDHVVGKKRKMLS